MAEKDTWGEVAGLFSSALRELTRAQVRLESLNVPHITENLKPHIEGIERFHALAQEKADGA